MHSGNAVQSPAEMKVSRSLSVTKKLVTWKASEEQRVKKEYVGAKQDEKLK